MSLLNALMRGVFDAVLYPFRGLDPLVGLVAVSLPISIGMLVAFKATSAQAELAAVKRRIHACLFEIRLFNDDLLAILRAQLEILRHNLTYLRLSLVPMVWLILPLTLIIAQLQFHYGYQGLEPGRPALLEVELKPSGGRGGDGVGAVARPSASLEVPEGLRVETPALWIPSRNRLLWRLAAERSGDYALTVKVGDAAETKSVRVADGIVRRSPIRVDSSLLNQLLYPAEPPLPDQSPILAISLHYPERDVEVFGWPLHWMIVFFALTIVFAFVLRGPFKVTL
jgi:hypothetical protein